MAPCKKEHQMRPSFTEVGLNFVEEIKQVKKNAETEISGRVWELDVVNCVQFIFREWV